MERRGRVSASESRLGLDLTRASVAFGNTQQQVSVGRLDRPQGTSKHFPAPVPVLCQAGARVRGGPARAHFYATCGVLLTVKPSGKVFFFFARVCSHFNHRCNVSLCRSKPRLITAYPQRCTVTHGPAGALQGAAMGDDVASAAS